MTVPVRPVVEEIVKVVNVQALQPSSITSTTPPVTEFVAPAPSLSFAAREPFPAVSPLVHTHQ